MSFLENPIKIALSNASNYVDDAGMLEITKADNPVIDVLKPQSINTIYNW
jgi:hypothetical protein